MRFEAIYDWINIFWILLDADLLHITVIVCMHVINQCLMHATHRVSNILIREMKGQKGIYQQQQKYQIESAYQQFIYDGYWRLFPNQIF